MARSMVPLLLLCMAAAMEGAAALHLCVDRLYDSTQGKHDDGLPHLNPTEEATWMALLPRKLGAKAEFDWLALYRSLTRHAGGGGAPAEFLSQASLHDIRLGPGSMYWQGQQTNLEYLLYLDPDRLTWSFRQQAGLPTVGEPYGGWEAPDGQLRGHFVGHYLSASAHMWASTHNDTLREKMARVVDILDDCQRKMGTGYLSAYPDEAFDMYEELSEAWSPYYSIHKIMQGLLDQYTLAGNRKGLGMVVWMTDYFSERVKNLIQTHSIQRHWEAMNEETGGLNDVMYQLYTLTKEQKHLTMAHLFDKPCFLGPLSLHGDDIAGLHVNTHIPVLIGAQKRYEVVGDHLYKDIATFFFDVVNSSHTFATGGTSTMEHWHDPKRLVDEIKISSNEETCTTYNLLKVSRNLFRWTKEVKYADHYERLLINGIMGNQRGTQPGVMIYFLPMGPGRSKSISGGPPSGLPPKNPGGWGGPNDTFWCCYGTGIESFSKLGDTIYFLEEGEVPGLYIAQHIPSTFDWKAAGLTVVQQAKPLLSTDSYFEVTISISAKGDAQPAKVSVRIPSWTSTVDATATLNGQKLNLTSAAYRSLAGDFLTLTKLWGDDTLVLQFPINLRTEAIKDDRPEYASIQAVLFGPHLLAGLTHGNKTINATEHSNDGLTPGMWEVDARNATSTADWIAALPHQAINSQLVTLTQQSGAQTFVLSVSATDGTLTMDEMPAAGSDACVRATIVVDTYVVDSTAAEHGAAAPVLHGPNVTIAPFDRPGMAITNGFEVKLHPGPEALFNAVPGLDGLPGSVSLELGTRPGCFVTAPGGARGYRAGDKAQVGCRTSGGDDAAFRKAASFTQAAPLRRYHPLSFVAKGTERSFVLEPLRSLQDEFYTVYFNLVTAAADS
uniref:Alpha-L-arabinofuranosidase B arabinose-binding domain-containing protein n=1 Tax=Aegilops tauschii subsp. strangulata TaxID=200361 RepID=A0A453SKZ0_AEGTS